MVESFKVRTILTRTSLDRRPGDLDKTSVFNVNLEPTPWLAPETNRILAFLGHLTSPLCLTLSFALSASVSFSHYSE
jgi:hypothetical protein